MTTEISLILGRGANKSTSTEVIPNVIKAMSNVSHLQGPDARQRFRDLVEEHVGGGAHKLRGD
jgi:hypothetical protein